MQNVVYKQICSTLEQISIVSIEISKPVYTDLNCESLGERGIPI